MIQKVKELDIFLDSVSKEKVSWSNGVEDSDFGFARWGTYLHMEGGFPEYGLILVDVSDFCFLTWKS